MNVWTEVLKSQINSVNLNWIESDCLTKFWNVKCNKREKKRNERTETRAILIYGIDCWCSSTYISKWWKNQCEMGVQKWNTNNKTKSKYPISSTVRSGEKFRKHCDKRLNGLWTFLFQFQNEISFTHIYFPCVFYRCVCVSVTLSFVSFSF